MPANSVVDSAGLHLAKGVIYRARMQINAPGVVATEGKVRDALAQQGFADISFFDKKQLPPDWPADQVEDPSGAFSWTAYLQGRFTLTDRLITFKELPGTVDVLGMWTYLVPVSQPPPRPVPVVPTPDVPLPGTVPPGSTTDISLISKVLVSAGSMAAAFGFVRLLIRRTRRRAHG